MNARRVYERFAHRGANFRICCERIRIVQDEICRQRGILEQYIDRHTEFGASLEPMPTLDDAPVVARRMSAAAAALGVGPMAAVAGAMAQLAAEAAMSDGASEVIVENGGDVWIKADEKVTVAVYAGDSPLSMKIGIEIDAIKNPVAVCTSSGTIGHSVSFGKADAAVVVSHDACLADVCATRLGNEIKCKADIKSALEMIFAINGVMGAVAVVGEACGAIGEIELKNL